MAIVISVANQKGGVSKTTTSVNLAAAIALTKKNVLLIDIDAQANATSSLVDNYGDRIKNSYAVVLNPQKIRDNIIQTTQPNLFILPGSPSLLNIERHIGNQTDRTERLFNARKLVDDKFDYIIIDCPPSLTLLPINSFIASDFVIIPIQCEYFSMEGLSQIIDVVNDIRETKNVSLRLMGILLTMYDESVESAREIIDQVHSVFNERVFKTIIPRDPSLSEAPSHGVSIFGYSITSHGALCYARLAEEVLGHGQNRKNAQ